MQKADFRHFAGFNHSFSLMAVNEDSFSVLTHTTLQIRGDTATCAKFRLQPFLGSLALVSPTMACSSMSPLPCRNSARGAGDG